MYGVVETNPLDGGEHPCYSLEDTVDLADPRLKSITRLRLLTDRGLPFFDVSYCYGVLADGTPVRVNLPRHQFGRRMIKHDIIDMCRREGVFAKGLGLLDESNWSVLYG